MLFHGPISFVSKYQTDANGIPNSEESSPSARPPVSQRMFF